MEVAGAERMGVTEQNGGSEPISSNADRKKYVKLYVVGAVAIILMIVVGLSVGLTKRLTPTERGIQKACRFFFNYDDVPFCLQHYYYGANFDEFGPKTIPSEIGLLTHMTSLQLYNDLIGTIPSTVGNLHQLQYLYITGTQLNGTLPSSLRNLVQLRTLSVHNNVHLTGTIPSTFGQLTELTSLDLVKNSGLVGTIPSIFGKLIQLTYLALHGSNQLSGTIPSTFGNLKNINRLELGNTNLSGTIPAVLCNISGIGIFIDCDKIESTCCSSMAYVYIVY